MKTNAAQYLHNDLVVAVARFAAAEIDGASSWNDGEATYEPVRWIAQALGLVGHERVIEKEMPRVERALRALGFIPKGARRPTTVVAPHADASMLAPLLVAEMRLESRREMLAHDVARSRSAALLGMTPERAEALIPFLDGHAMLASGHLKSTARVRIRHEREV